MFGRASLSLPVAQSVPLTEGTPAETCFCGPAQEFSRRNFLSHLAIRHSAESSSYSASLHSRLWPCRPGFGRHSHLPLAKPAHRSPPEAMSREESGKADIPRLSRAPVGLRVASSIAGSLPANAARNAATNRPIPKSLGCARARLLRVWYRGWRLPAELPASDFDAANCVHGNDLPCSQTVG